MPADYRIDEAAERVVSTASGVLTDRDLIDHQNRLRADTRFRSDFDQISSFLGVERLDISAEAIRTLAVGNPFGAGSRRALVVDSPLAYGLARMFQSYADESPDEIEIFREMSRAEQWIAGRARPRVIGKAAASPDG